MRMLALFMINIFVALYLYREGYEIIYIAYFYAVSYIFRSLAAYPAARYVAKFGPKHGVLVANLLYIPALIFFPFVPDIGLPALIAFGVFQSLSLVLFDLAFNVDFSKVKHADHAGKEIGYMQILERLTHSLSPFIGGFIAFIIFPAATMWLSALLLATASLPLLRTKEPVRLNQKLEFKHFPWRLARRSIITETAIGFDIFASNIVWVLFITTVVFLSTGNDIYFTVGVFASLTAVTSFVAAYSYGRIIDWRHGGDLLRIMTIANSATHLFRPFVSTPAGVAATNVMNELATTGYAMAFMRGIYDTADSATGHRIVYLYFICVAINVGAFLSSLVFILLLHVFGDPVPAMQLFFVLTAIYVLLPIKARFELYR